MSVIPSCLLDFQHYCTSKGGHLVHVNNANENNFIRDVIMHQAPTAHWWLGANDDTTEGVWQWVDDDSSLQFNDFWPGMPDGDGDCAFYSHGGDYKWDDANCQLAYNGICELKIQKECAPIIG
ncbi:C-type lectin domain family 10 member A-like [Mya arenaria]|uniref:C-type lectin domain family 10 member A-like n=1 Tax=Mya arenaria TaxID=6604 RepID=UPI0022DEC61D|nr:C-type lectin domain family 10 member A-like [Mya arenaria]